MFPGQKRYVLGIWLLQNTKLHAVSQTHRSACPYDHRKWPKEALTLKNVCDQYLHNEEITVKQEYEIIGCLSAYHLP